jgi:hypothetical protein
MRKQLVFGFLVAILILFGIGILFKYKALSIQMIVNNKDFIEVAKDIILIITVVGGGILSYFNFFKGRTFSLKAEIHFDVKIFRTPNDDLLHIIKVEIENKGNFSIWDPRIILLISQYSTDGKVEKETIKNWWENSEFIEKSKRKAVLDSGEKAFFIVDRVLSPKIWLVTYKAELKAHNKTWQNSINIESKITNATIPPK